MVAKPKYNALKDGDTLSFETAFLQASTALDIAATLAVESKNAEQLTAIAEQYIEMGSRMMGPAPDEDELEEHDLLAEEFGFTPTDIAQEREAANGRTNKHRRTEAWSSRRGFPRIHKKHGKL